MCAISLLADVLTDLSDDTEEVSLVYTRLEVNVLQHDCRVENES